MADIGFVTIPFLKGCKLLFSRYRTVSEIGSHSVEENGVLWAGAQFLWMWDMPRHIPPLSWISLSAHARLHGLKQLEFFEYSSFMIDEADTPRVVINKHDRVPTSANQFCLKWSTHITVNKFKFFNCTCMGCHVYQNKMFGQYLYLSYIELWPLIQTYGERVGSN